MASRLRQAVRSATADERGATAIEYALIGAILVMVAIVGFETIGKDVAAMFTTIAAEFTP